MYKKDNDYGKEKLELERYLLNNKPIHCEMCNHKLFYLGSGKYECHDCGHVMYDEFGRVKAYLEENGIRPAAEVSMATGVPQAIITLFLKKGKLEIPENSKYYLKCEKCGCSIRYGRYCPECVQALAGGIKAVFNEDAGEKPKYDDSKTGKLHYMKRKDS